MKRRGVRFPKLLFGARPQGAAGAARVKLCVVARLLEPRKLAPDEIKFIRNAKGIKAKELAESIENSPEHLSRCESSKGEKTLSPALEKMLRIYVLTGPISEFLEIEDYSDDQKKRELEELKEAAKEILIDVSKILKNMKIKSAFDLENLLGFIFHRVVRDGGSLDDDHNGKWEKPKAA